MNEECQKCREEILVKVTRLETMMESITKNIPGMSEVRIHSAKIKTHSWLIGIIFTCFVGLTVAAVIK